MKVTVLLNLCDYQNISVLLVVTRCIVFLPIVIILLISGHRDRLGAICQF